MRRSAVVVLATTAVLGATAAPALGAKPGSGGTVVCHLDSAYQEVNEDGNELGIIYVKKAGKLVHEFHDDTREACPE